MFETIVWATDGSEEADSALPYVRDLAQKHGSAVVVVHVLETFTAHHAAGLPVHMDEPELKAKIERQAAELSAEGIDARAEVLPARAPHAAHVIADAAKDAGADLVVAGARGHTRLPGLAFGSVTHRLLQLSPCAILIVPRVGRD